MTWCLAVCLGVQRFDAFRLTKQTFENLRPDEKIFCRMEMIDGKGQKQGIGKSDLFNLPIYNKYFFIGNEPVNNQDEELEEEGEEVGEGGFGSPGFGGY